MEESLQAVLGDTTTLQEVSEIGGYSVTTLAKLKLTRKRLKQDEKPTELAKADIKFGNGPFFSLSGGIVISTLSRQEFQRVQGFARNKDGSPVLVDGQETLTSIVGLKDDSDTRILPLVMLNGRLFGGSGPLDGVHASLGVTAKNDNKGTDVEFLLGPSFSFLDRQLFFTLGGYAGKRQELAGDLFLGASVPKDLAEIPVRKNYKWNFGFAVTYKIK
jgi:hypothetical protein